MDFLRFKEPVFISRYSYSGANRAAANQYSLLAFLIFILGINATFFSCSALIRMALFIQSCRLVSMLLMASWKSFLASTSLFKPKTWSPHSPFFLSVSILIQLFLGILSFKLLSLTLFVLYVFSASLSLILSMREYFLCFMDST